MSEYDVLEKLIIPPTYRDQINNDNFGKWNDSIIKHVSTRTSNGGREDYSGEDLNLLKDCTNHIQKYSQPLDSDNIVALTHPLYLFLTHSKELNFISKMGAQKYFDNLFKLFKNKSSIDANIVIFETLHHYADSTCRLLEEGFIDTVFFTKYDNGAPNNTLYRSSFKDKNLFFGGGYNEKCLSTTVRNAISNGKYKSRWCISNLSLNSPQDTSFIFADCITDDGRTIIPLDNTITLDSFLKKVKK